MAGLIAAHRGYEYQDLLVACRLVDMLRGSVVQVHVDERLIETGPCGKAVLRWWCQRSNRYVVTGSLTNSPRLGLDIGLPSDRSNVEGFTRDDTLAIRQARAWTTRSSLAAVMQAPGYAELSDDARLIVLRRAMEEGMGDLNDFARTAHRSGQRELVRLLAGQLENYATTSQQALDSSPHAQAIAISRLSDTLQDIKNRIRPQ